MVAPTLHSHGVWSRLTELTRQHKTASVAVPYFGSGASKLLPLKNGSTLVLRFDRHAVQCGQVNPNEVIALLKAGVEVHACANLHAKIFVFGDVAIVGSSNVSSSSANSLIEACVEITGRPFAQRCKNFVDSLRGDQIGLEFAKTMIPLYKPPQTNGIPRMKGKSSRRVLPHHSDIWLVPLVSADWKDVDHEQEQAGWSRAERALTDPDRSEIETFCWWGGGKLLRDLERGHRVLMNTKVDARKALVSPPGRVLSVRRYRAKNKTRAIIYVEVPKNKRSRNIASFVKSLGPAARGLGNPRRTKCLRDPALLYSLGKVFS